MKREERGMDGGRIEESKIIVTSSLRPGDLFPSQRDPLENRHPTLLMKKERI